MSGKQRFVGASIFATLIMILSVAVASAQTRPTVQVVDQDVIDGIVRVARASSDGPAWIAIHADADGEPGDVLGAVQFPGGIGATIDVSIGDSEVATGDVLHAVLHTASGEGDFDPTVETPIEYQGAIVSDDFTVEEVGSSLLRVIADSDLSALFEAAETAGLAGHLADGGPYTIFAPSDAALAATTLPADAAEASALLEGHIVPGILASSAITESQELTSLTGTPIDVQVADDGTITVNGFTISQPDLAAFNGIIHVIDGVILPPVPEEEAATEEPVEEAAAAEATPEATEEPAEETAAAEATPEATEEPVEEVAAAEATPEATEEPVEEAAAADATPEATEEPVEEAAAAEATPEATEEPVEEAAAAEATPEATEEPVEEAAAAEATPEATEEPVEEAAAADATPEATEEPVEEAAATEVAPEELPATGAPASPVLPMVAAGVVLVALALFAIVFRRKTA